MSTIASNVMNLIISLNAPVLTSNSQARSVNLDGASCFRGRKQPKHISPRVLDLKHADFSGLYALMLALIFAFKLLLPCEYNFIYRSALCAKT